MQTIQRYTKGNFHKSLRLASLVFKQTNRCRVMCGKGWKNRKKKKKRKEWATRIIAPVSRSNFSASNLTYQLFPVGISRPLLKTALGSAGSLWTGHFSHPKSEIDAWLTRIYWAELIVATQHLSFRTSERKKKKKKHLKSTPRPAVQQSNPWHLRVLPRKHYGPCHKAASQLRPAPGKLAAMFWRTPTGSNIINQHGFEKHNSSRIWKHLFRKVHPFPFLRAIRSDCSTLKKAWEILRISLSWSKRKKRHFLHWCCKCYFWICA